MRAAWTDRPDFEFESVRRQRRSLSVRHRVNARPALANRWGSRVAKALRSDPVDNGTTSADRSCARTAYRRCETGTRRSGGRSTGTPHAGDRSPARRTRSGLARHRWNFAGRLQLPALPSAPRFGVDAGPRQRRRAHGRPARRCVPHSSATHLSTLAGHHPLGHRRAGRRGGTVPRAAHAGAGPSRGCRTWCRGRGAPRRHRTAGRRTGGAHAGSGAGRRCPLGGGR